MFQDLIEAEPAEPAEASAGSASSGVLSGASFPGTLNIFVSMCL